MLEVPKPQGAHHDIVPQTHFSCGIPSEGRIENATFLPQSSLETMADGGNPAQSLLSCNGPGHSIPIAQTSS
jgi:hypothetical protein